MGGSLRRRSALGLVLVLALAGAGDAGSVAENPLDVGPPLGPEERATVIALEHALGSPEIAERERAAELLRQGPGARAADLLLDLVERERDPEARFRARSLVQSLLLRHFLATPCGPAWLGVMFSPTSTDRHANAIRCDEVLKGGPAFRAGFKDGEIVVLVDGKPFRDGNDLRDVIHGIPPGACVALTVERDGEDAVIHVILGDLKASDGKPAPPERDRQRDLARWRLAAWLAARARGRDVAAATSAAR
jgi:membrane-associated protease RseP (regulator of RpoE activity)